jgi:hypothetical protein
MSAGAIAEGILLISGGVFIIVFSLVILRSDTWIDIVTDQLLRRPGRPLDRRRLASWMRAVSLFPAGIGGIFGVLGIASLAVGLLG